MIEDVFFRIATYPSASAFRYAMPSFDAVGAIQDSSEAIGLDVFQNVTRELSRRQARSLKMHVGKPNSHTLLSYVTHELCSREDVSSFVHYLCADIAGMTFHSAANDIIPTGRDGNIIAGTGSSTTGASNSNIASIPDLCARIVEPLCRKLEGAALSGSWPCSLRCAMSALAAAAKVNNANVTTNSGRDAHAGAVGSVGISPLDILCDAVVPEVISVLLLKNWKSQQYQTLHGRKIRTSIDGILGVRALQTPKQQSAAIGTADSIYSSIPFPSVSNNPSDTPHTVAVPAAAADISSEDLHHDRYRNEELIIVMIQRVRDLLFLCFDQDLGEHGMNLCLSDTAALARSKWCLQR